MLEWSASYAAIPSLYTILYCIRVLPQHIHYPLQRGLRSILQLGLVFCGNGHCALTCSAGLSRSLLSRRASQSLQRQRQHAHQSTCSQYVPAWHSCPQSLHCCNSSSIVLDPYLYSERTRSWQSARKGCCTSYAPLAASHACRLEYTPIWLVSPPGAVTTSTYM